MKIEADVGYPAAVLENWKRARDRDDPLPGTGDRAAPAPYPLVEQSQPVYRQGHLERVGSAFRLTMVEGSQGNWKDDGPAGFAAFTSQVRGTVPVHTYLSDRSQRWYWYDRTPQSYSGWTRRDPVFYAFATARKGTVPIYEYKSHDGWYIYTAFPGGDAYWRSDGQRRSGWCSTPSRARAPTGTADCSQASGASPYRGRRSEEEDGMNGLNGKVVAITGATAGIGRATARAVRAAGGKAVVGGRRQERLDELTEEIGAVGVQMDVRDRDGSRRLVEAAIDNYGQLDALVANAGIGHYGGIMDVSDEALAEMMETNIAGTVWPIRAAVPHLLEKGGDIVIVSSVAGLRGAGDEAVYAATKFAQVGLAGALDRELREKGIRVTTICPGGVATEFAMGSGRTPDMPGLAKMLSPEDVADAIVYALQQPETMRTLVWSMRSIHEPD